MTSHGIEDARREHLLKDGYVSLPGALPPSLLTRLQEMADRLETEALADHEVGRTGPCSAIVETPNGPGVMRLDKILESDSEAVLTLLACPAMMAVSQVLCGHGTVPIEMDLLFKQQHPNGYIIWHQGAQHSRRWPYLNIGVYLDDAPIDDGCLRYVPGTQGEKQDICGLSGKYGWDIPGAIDVPAKAGDILVQDMMVLHCSLPKRTPRQPSYHLHRVAPRTSRGCGWVAISRMGGTAPSVDGHGRQSCRAGCLARRMALRTAPGWCP